MYHRVLVRKITYYLLLAYPVKFVAPIVIPSIMAGKPAINVNYIFSVEDYAFFFWRPT